MEKLRMQTADGAQDNIRKLQSLFPDCVTEAKDKDGRTTLKVDKDKLLQNLSGVLLSDKEERYQFTWPDKMKAILATNAPINATLRPCREESLDFDNTQNLYIEGDNLDVLKCLKETYLGEVKMIYIDPPYNTGNDFVYEDDFAQITGEYVHHSGQLDDQGNRLFRNKESNGRFHTDWLNMIYPRLKVARELLSYDGVIFISIDDSEQANMKKVCDEVFGERNFVAQLIWQRAYSPKNDAKYISNSHDYVIMYARDIDNFVIGRLPRTEEADARYSNPDNDPRGVWKPSDMSVKTYNADCDYPITTPSGKIVEPPAARCWSLSKNAFLERLQDNRIWFGADGNSVPCIKRFLTELKFEGMAPTSVLYYKDVGHSQEGAKEVVSLFEDKGVFDGPKPVRLLKRLLTLANLKEDSIVLDFFSGSATTAHALMQINEEKGLHSKFIMVQLPEQTPEGKGAYKAGYTDICQIGKERIRRAGKKIKEESPLTTNDLDTGFRVLKLDSTNMEDVYYTPKDLDQGSLPFQVENVKEGRTSEDLLFQVMLELGATLDSKIEVLNVEGKNIYNVAEGYLAACFDKEVSDSVVTHMAKMTPVHAVLRDNSVKKDSTLTNFEQIFRKYSPTTNLKTL